MNLHSKATILFIGDSITDASRDASGEAAPWLPHFGLGQGYVAQVWAWLTATHPELHLRVVNKGVSGNTVRDLSIRWQQDVLDLRPDVLCVMIGINDVWRQFDAPSSPSPIVTPEEFRETLARLIAEAGATGSAIYLATPFFLEPNREEPMRKRMDEYGRVVRELAEAHKAFFVDVQAAFDRVMAQLHPSALAWDRIHPGPHGHMVIARAFLQAFGVLKDS